MKLIKILKQLLLEKKGDTYNYGAVMLYFNFPEIKKIHNKIEKNDLYEKEGDSSYGIEDDPHTTLLYGIHSDEVVDQDIVDVVSNIPFGICIINNVSIFDNPEYDVLKFDVIGKGLKECNTALKKFKHTNDYPDYHPHLTIAYLKKGLGEKYIKLFGKEDYQMIPSKGVYSKPDGEKKNIEIKTYDDNK